MAYILKKSVFCMFAIVLDDCSQASRHAVDEVGAVFPSPKLLLWPRQRSGRLEGCFSATLSFITVHKFSIGLRSGCFQASPRPSLPSSLENSSQTSIYGTGHHFASIFCICGLACVAGAYQRTVERTFRRSWWFHWVNGTSRWSHVATLPSKSIGSGGVSW